MQTPTPMQTPPPMLVMWPEMHAEKPTPTPPRQTNSCENITLPQTSFADDKLTSFVKVCSQQVTLSQTLRWREKIGNQPILPIAVPFTRSKVPPVNVAVTVMESFGVSRPLDRGAKPLKHFNALRLYVQFFFFFFKFLEDMSPFLWGHWYPCFGLLVTSPLGFKARVGSALFELSRGIPVMLHVPWDSPLVWHLLTSWWPAWQLSHLFHIPARHWWDSKPGAIMPLLTVWDQADALPTELYNLLMRTWRLVWFEILNFAIKRFVDQVRVKVEQSYWSCRE